MTQLSFLQFGHNLESDQYTVTASFNGHPGTPGNLIYNATSKQYEAVVSGNNEAETFTLTVNASSHLGAYDAYTLGHIAAGNLLALKGGGIIKTTKFPPPNKKKGAAFVPVNAGLLSDVYLSEVTILRIGSGQDFTVQVTLKNRPGHTYSFQIKNLSIHPSIQGRDNAFIFVEVESGPNLEETSSIAYSNPGMSFLSPCSIVMDKAPWNMANNYDKSAWFYMLP